MYTHNECNLSFSNFVMGFCHFLLVIYIYIYIYIYISAVKRLIAPKIKVFVDIIYVCVLCIFIMYI